MVLRPSPVHNPEASSVPGKVLSGRINVCQAGGITVVSARSCLEVAGFAGQAGSMWAIRSSRELTYWILCAVVMFRHRRLPEKV